jgi:hypothetical protein
LSEKRDKKWLTDVNETQLSSPYSTECCIIFGGVFGSLLRERDRERKREREQLKLLP